LVEAYQIHATLQVLALVSLLVGAYGARKHKLRMHHGSVYTAVVLTTLAVVLMLYQSGGLPTIHGKVGFSVYLFILVTALSGRLFLGRRLTRNQHRALAFSAIPLLLFMILYGLSTFVL